MLWLDNLLGPDMPMSAQIAILVAVLVVALLLLFWLFRKIFGGASARLAKSRQPRLSVTDAAVVDDKRRLVLVRRDNVEHLVMIGGPSDVVIEQNIVRAAPVAVPTAQPYQPAPAPAPTPARIEPAPTPQPEPEPKRANMFPNPDKSSVAAAGGAALAGAGALAMSAKETTVETASNAAANVTSTVSETVSNITETAGEALESATETISETFSPPSAAEPEVTQAAAQAEPARNVFDAPAESELTADLDDALRTDIPEVSSQSEANDDGSKTEDEMQRLLKELSEGN